MIVQRASWMIFGILTSLILGGAWLHPMLSTAEAQATQRGFASQDEVATQVVLPFIVVGAYQEPLVPEAVDDAYRTPADTPLLVDAVAGVLANDLDPAQAGLQATLTSGVSHGDLALEPDGSFLYTPEAGFVGEDTFSYRAIVGLTASNEATVIVVVTSPDNGLPVAVDDTYEGQEDTQLVVPAENGVVANDTNPDQDVLRAVLVSDVSNGNLGLNPDGSFAYTPTADFNGQDTFTYLASDGTAESNIATVTISVLPINSAPSIVSGEVAFGKQVIGKNVITTHAVVVADLDRDGDLDAAATDYINGRVLWYENDGSGGFTERVLDPALEGAYPAGVGDVDQDGHVDVLAAGYLANTFVWYRNEGSGNFTRRVVDDQALGAHSIVTADLDEDGDIDFVIASQDANTIGWYENDGNENFTLRVIDDTATDAKRAEVADVDGDGDLDVVTASFRIDTIAWYENDGNQTFTLHVIDDAADGAYYVAPADADGDGDIDVFAAIRDDSTIALYRNDGVEVFSKEILDNDMVAARTALAADIDGDGDMDVVGTSVNGDLVRWYENKGTGKFTKRLVSDETNGAYGAFVIDMDFDGDLDVLSASKIANEVALHSQYRAHTATVAKGDVLVINADLLRTVDVDDSPADLRYVLTAVPVYGELHLLGATLVEGDAFTQEDINAGRVTYTHLGSDRTPDAFSFAVADGGEGGIQPAMGTFDITITR